MKIYLGLFCFLILIGCGQKNNVKIESSNQQENGYEIAGKIEGIKVGKVILHRAYKGSAIPIDTNNLDGGKFIFNGMLDHPEMLYIRVLGEPGIISFFAENSKIRITSSILNLNDFQITGSKTDSIYMAVQDELFEIQQRKKIIEQEYLKARDLGDEASRKELDSIYKIESKKQRDLIELTIRENNNTVLAPYFTMEHLFKIKTLEELEKIYNNYDSAILTSKYSIIVKEKIEILRNTQIGSKAPDFIQFDTLGKMYKLSDFRNKFVLLNFWKSQCGKCVADFKELDKLKNRYNDMELAIISINLDNNDLIWRDISKQLKISWINLSDSEGEFNKAGVDYGINKYPSIFLIDQNGIIIDKDFQIEKAQELLDLNIQ